MSSLSDACSLGTVFLLPVCVPSLTEDIHVTRTYAPQWSPGCFLSSSSPRSLLSFPSPPPLPSNRNNDNNNNKNNSVAEEGGGGGVHKRGVSPCTRARSGPHPDSESESWSRVEISSSRSEGGVSIVFRTPRFCACSCSSMDRRRRGEEERTREKSRDLEAREEGGDSISLSFSRDAYQNMEEGRRDVENVRGEHPSLPPPMSVEDAEENEDVRFLLELDHPSHPQNSDVNRLMENYGFQETLFLWSDIIGARVMESDESCFCIMHVAKRDIPGRKGRRRLHDVIFRCEKMLAHRIAWIIMCTLLGKDPATCSELPSPLRVLLILNPVSGKRLAEKMYIDEVEPIFSRSLIDCDLRTTEYARHATDIGRWIDLSRYDAVGGMGGDGILFELLNGIGERSQGVQLLKSTIFFVIPAGSGNALATTTGMFCAADGAVALCHRHWHSVDLFRFEQGEKLHYGFLSVSYGLSANADVGTDHLRWMGPLRFTYAVIRDVLKKRRYAHRMYVLEAPPTYSSPFANRCGQLGNDAAAVVSSPFVSCPASALCSDLDSQDRSERGDAHVQDLDFSDCHISLSYSQSSFSDIEEDRRSRSLGPSLLDSVRTSFPDLCGDEMDDGRIGEWSDEGRWIVFHSKSFIFFIVNVPWIASDMHLCPPCRLDSGVFDLFLVRDASRCEAIKLFLDVESGDHFEKASSLIEHRRLLAMRFEPVDTNTYIDLDGELMSMEPFEARILPGATRVIVPRGYSQVLSDTPSF